MKGFRFYAESRKRVKALTALADAGTQINVVAVDVEIDRWTGKYEALGSVFDHPNSDVATTSVSGDFLLKKCKRISERLARRLHPKLFERLDA